MTDHHEGAFAEYENLERYRRQMAIDGWGKEAQKKLSRASVTVVGAGGLGGPVLLYLTAAGVGHLRIFDDDRISLSNLNRQILYGDTLLDRPKAESAAARLRSLNPSIEIEAHSLRLDSKNLDQRLSRGGILVDCLDNFESRFLLNRHAVVHRIPLVHGGVAGFTGQITTVIPGETPCLECLFAGESGALPGGDGTSEIPVLGASVGTIGCLQALEVLKLITGLGNPLKNRLLLFDGLETRFDEISVKPNDRCGICGVYWTEK